MPAAMQPLQGRRRQCTTQGGPQAAIGRPEFAEPARAAVRARHGARMPRTCISKRGAAGRRRSARRPASRLPWSRQAARAVGIEPDNEAPRAHIPGGCRDRAHARRAVRPCQGQDRVPRGPNMPPAEAGRERRRCDAGSGGQRPMRRQTGLGRPAGNSRRCRIRPIDPIPRPLPPASLRGGAVAVASWPPPCPASQRCRRRARRAARTAAAPRGTGRGV